MSSFRHQAYKNEEGCAPFPFLIFLKKKSFQGGNVHEYNKYDKANELIDKMLQGKNVALITDAGTPAIEVETPMASSAAEVLHNLETNKADIEASVREMQRLSDMVTGHKLRFNVNSELDKVVVTVVNASTNEVIRQIPSEDVQKIQARMKQAIGVLFDEII